MVEPLAHGQWYDLFLTKFVPFLTQQGFDEVSFWRVLTDDNNSHYTYSLQIRVEDLSLYKAFTDVVMVEYSAIVNPMFGQRVLHFTSVLKNLSMIVE